MIKGRKIATTIASIKPAVENLLIVSTKMVLVEDSRNVSMRGSEFRILVYKRQILTRVRKSVIFWN